MELIYPGLGLIFWMTLSFLLLFLILRKFAWKPILNMLHEREQKIEDALHAADMAREEMKKLQVDNEKLLRDAKVEREKILAEARQLKEKILAEAKLKGNEEAERMIDAAREAIKFEKMSALTELKNQVALLSIDIAEKVLAQDLEKTEKQEKLINTLLNEINFN